MSVMGRYAVLGAQLIRRGPRPTSSAGWREERLALLTVRADDEVVDCVDLAVSMMCAAEYVVERAGAAQDRRALLDPDQPAPVLPSAALLAQARDAADAECITQLTHDRVDTLVSASNAPSRASV